MAIDDGKLRRLQEVLEGTRGTVVAFSGGVDSALVAAVAARALGERALAVTAVSPSLPPGELNGAKAFAGALGIRHRVVRTHEMELAAYRANGPDRCYQCKSELYRTLGAVARSEELDWVASGTNVDDLGDVRPGLMAAEEWRVLHPLVEAGITKTDVRELSRELGLPTWDKPASACLSSRFPHGVMITVEGLSRVGRAERTLKAMGFRQVRVRDHGEVARIEVEGPDIARLAEPGRRSEVVAALRAEGYRYVALDLEGFRSGNMNLSSDPGDAIPPAAHDL